MLKALKLWLNRRQAQKQWEHDERLLAYELLGEYKAATVLSMKMSSEDKKNIAALMTDEKYMSLRKLEHNLVAQWIQKCVHVQGADTDLRKGGIKIYTAIQKAIENAFVQGMQNEAERDQMNKTLNGIGW